MKGIIFNLAAEVITDSHGDDAWDAVLDAAGLDGAYTSLGNYPDEDLSRLVAAAADQLAQSPDNVMRALGEGAMPILFTRYPAFFEPHTSTRSFLLTLNDIIHAEVRKLYPDAHTPEFSFDETDDEHLVLCYRSPRMLCMLAEGFIRGAASLFAEEAGLEQTECMHRGAESCVIACTFSSTRADE